MEKSELLRMFSDVLIKALKFCDEQAGLKVMGKAMAPLQTTAYLQVFLSHCCEFAVVDKLIKYFIYLQAPLREYEDKTTGKAASGQEFLV